MYVHGELESSLLENLSGFPTTGLSIGRIFFHTGDNCAYILRSLLPIIWEVVSGVVGSVSITSGNLVVPGVGSGASITLDAINNELNFDDTSSAYINIDASTEVVYYSGGNANNEGYYLVLNYDDSGANPVFDLKPISYINAIVCQTEPNPDNVALNACINIDGVKVSEYNSAKWNMLFEGDMSAADRRNKIISEIRAINNAYTSALANFTDMAEFLILDVTFIRSLSFQIKPVLVGSTYATQKMSLFLRNIDDLPLSVEFRRLPLL